MGYLRGSHVPAAPIPTPRISPISFIPGLCGQPVLFSRDLRQIFQHQHSSSHVYTPIQNERSLHTQQIHLADCASHQRRSVLQTFRKIHPLDTIFETIMDIPLFETHNFCAFPQSLKHPANFVSWKSFFCTILRFFSANHVASQPLRKLGRHLGWV